MSVLGFVVGITGQWGRVVASIPVTPEQSSLVGRGMIGQMTIGTA